MRCFSSYTSLYLGSDTSTMIIISVPFYITVLTGVYPHHWQNKKNRMSLKRYQLSGWVICVRVKWNRDQPLPVMLEGTRGWNENVYILITSYCLTIRSKYSLVVWSNSEWSFWSQMYTAYSSYDGSVYTSHWVIGSAVVIFSCLVGAW
jgi:hypothetical protein